ncbi:uncharacterized protein N7506_003442 [Penicillium brevicompactum]|uniref:uncharacterized protein n=1 Tax=Penicillium brevicompactum TaxID=5074 RepID=UPI00253FB79B|nr:uncharacterized protein N7506_003442 [Penicillium brevicompactum]KAJ5343618.1 hypothetical protein N7506_003442 [Penicillium brevicompactum]
MPDRPDPGQGKRASLAWLAIDNSPCAVGTERVLCRDPMDFDLFSRVLSMDEAVHMVLVGHPFRIGLLLKLAELVHLSKPAAVLNEKP